MQFQIYVGLQRSLFSTTFVHVPRPEKILLTLLMYLFLLTKFSISDTKVQVIALYCCKMYFFIFQDGTFDFPLFAQLYTIHAVFNGAIFPVVYCLLPNKTQDMYTSIYNRLKQTEVQCSSNV